MKVGYLVVAVLVLAGCLYAEKFKPIQNPSRSLLLDEVALISGDPYFEQVLAVQRTNPEKAERAKIEYLIERIRRSHLSFIRNGEAYTGRVAAQLVGWKYNHRREEIKSAEEFIQKLATRSSTSGKPYVIQFPDGTTCFACDVLHNELYFLENRLRNPISTT